MKIALINENSQCVKNEMIYNSLKKVTEKYGHEVLNFGTYNAEDETQLTYVEVGLLSAILLNTKTVDFVVTGCGTGEGAMLANQQRKCRKFSFCKRFWLGGWTQFWILL